MTTDPLSEIRAREAAATEDTYSVHTVGLMATVSTTVDEWKRLYTASQDRTFLLAEIDRLRAEVEWQPIETAPRDGRWLIAHSNDRCYLYRISWGRAQDGELCWCSADRRYYGDGLFGGWIECPAIRTLAPRLADDGGGK